MSESEEFTLARAMTAEAMSAYLVLERALCTCGDGTDEGDPDCVPADGIPRMTETFLGELDARSWTFRAPCTDHPDLNWTCGPSRGIEAAATVVGCLNVCATCPVRPECLDDAIGDRAHTMMGIWGGTTMTERTKALALARPLVGSEAEASRIASDMLEHTFAARLSMWVARTKGRTPMALIVTETIPSCANCGQGFLWEGATCSKLCRRITKRTLIAVRQERGAA